MSEIMQDKAVSIATVLNWLVTLVVSAITPSITKPDSNIPYIFFTVGILTILGALFMIVFMKETKGKSQNEIAELYVVDKELTQMKKKVITERDDYGFSPWKNANSTSIEMVENDIEKARREDKKNEWPVGFWSNK